MQNKKPYVIGLTGGIASGKSEVTSYLRKKGYIVLDADQAYHQAMKKNGPAYWALIEHFGEKILSKKNEIDREKLADLVFQDPKKRKELDRLTHPIIFQVFMEKFHSIPVEDFKEGLVFFDIPLLFEMGPLRDRLAIDSIWLVAASEDTQANRLEKRNGLSREEALTRIRSQMPLEKKKRLSDKILYNEKDLETLYHEVDNALVEEREKNA